MGSARKRDTRKSRKFKRACVDNSRASGGMLFQIAAASLSAASIVRKKLATVTHDD